MKNYIQQISKLFSLIFLTLVLSLSIISCDNFSKDSDNNQTILTQPEFSTGNKGIVKIKLLTAQLQKSRTALPEALSIDNFSDFQLKGEINGTAVNLGSWGLPFDLECETFELEVGEWDLTLSATYNGYTYSDTKSINVTLSSVQQVDFVLSSDSISGGIILHLDFDTGKTVDHVSYELENYLTSTVIDSGNLTITNSEGINYVEYIKDYNDAIPSGTYRLSISFYGEADLLLNTYRELVRVKGGHQSSRYQFIDLNEVYTITYHNTEDATLVSGSLVEKYSINSDYSTIIFPDLSKPNYVFLGWYTEDDGGVQVTRLPDGSSGDQHFYARWQAYPHLTYKIHKYNDEYYELTDEMAEDYNLPLRHIPGVNTDLTVYNITDGESTTKITCTFYYDSNLAAAQLISGGIIGGSALTTDTIIYIEPEISHVYLSPTVGNDNNLGFNVSTPVQSVQVAEDWLGSDTSKIIYVKNSISNTNEIQDLSHGAIVKRHSSLTSSPILNLSLSSTTGSYGSVNLSDVTIDGGADFGSVGANSSVYSSTNGGIQASKPLINLGNQAALTMSDVILQNNDSSETTGAILINNGSTVTMTDCTITKCRGKQGGAVSINGSTLNMTNCLVKNNAATEKGGAFFFVANGAKANLTGVTFNANASVNGGVMYINQSSALTTIDTCTFTNNVLTGSTGKGQIIYDLGSTLSTANSNLFIKGDISIDAGDIYTDVKTPVMLHVSTKATGTANPIVLTPESYGTAPDFDKKILDFTNVASASISDVKAYFTLGGPNPSNYEINNEGYIKPKSGTITVTPGFPGTYSCGYKLTKNGSNRTINLVLKDISGATASVVAPSLINSLKVTLYETGDAIKTWTGTAANNFAEALEFTYPSYLDDPTNTSFYVEVSIKPTSTSDVAYSYDFWPNRGYIGSKVPTEAKEVGDIVFNDGSAEPYVSGMTISEEQKSAAIALIFYKGTALNSSTDTTTSRTLGVGLKHNNSGLAWCTASAQAFNNNITSIQFSSTYNNVENSFTFGGDLNGSDNLSEIGVAIGADTDISTEDNYPAFWFAKKYNTVTGSNVSGGIYEEGWYLPTVPELYYIYACRADTINGFDIDAASESLGGNKFETDAYWSSSQDSDSVQNAYVFKFETEIDFNGRKKSLANAKVCAIHEF